MFLTFLFVGFSSAQVGRVGINTVNPQNTLHVAGTFRTDSAKTVTSTKRFAVLDSNGVLQSLPSDSLKSIFANTNLSSFVFYASNETQANTSSSTMQNKVTLSLPAGTYMVWSYFEAFNVNTNAGVRGTLAQDGTEIAYGELWSDISTYSPWNAMREITSTATTTIALEWGSWPNGTTSYIRRARIVALRVQ